MRDMVDVTSLVFHSSPDPKLFHPKVALKSITFDPTLGISYRIEPDNWPDYLPPNWQGPIHCTLWAGFMVDNRPHVAGFIQFHRGDNPKIWTGAPILQKDIATNKLQWNVNWAFDNRWAPLNSYTPVAGNKMILFLTAGNARKGSAGFEPDITSVAERTNIVVVDLPPANELRTFTFNDDMTNVTYETEPPKPSVAINENFSKAILESIEVLSEMVVAIKELKDEFSELRTEVGEIKNRQDSLIHGKVNWRGLISLQRTDKV